MARKFDINFARWPAKQVLTHLSGAIREFGVRVKDLEESDPYYGLQWEDYADVHDALVGLAS